MFALCVSTKLSPNASGAGAVEPCTSYTSALYMLLILLLGGGRGKQIAPPPLFNDLTHVFVLTIVP